MRPKELLIPARSSAPREVVTSRPSPESMEPMGPERSTASRVDTRILAGAATTLLFLEASCTSGANPVDSRPAPEVSGTEAGAATQQIRVTRDTNRGPEACHPQQVGETVINHFEAINKGDSSEALKYVAPEAGWYSVTEGNPRDGGRHFVARDSDKLREYLNRRATVNERIYLVEIDVAYERARNLGHVSYILRRTADDLDPYGNFAQGKGAIDCEDGKIQVWSMAQAKDILLGLPRLCPGKPDPPAFGLVCARD